VCASIVLCCVYTVSCFGVKIEADSNDITECPHDDKSWTGMFWFFKCVCFIYVY